MSHLLLPRLRRALVTFAACAVAIGSIATANANAMHVSNNGTGQVLLFPYYTARNGNASLLSLVNTTTQAKAVRVNVREARGGFVVAQFNVYLSAKDVWTAAIVSDADGAQLVTNDKSCTAPAIGSGLPFNADAYSADVSTLRSRDRTREGYLEVIEMASIPNAKPTGIAVTHVSGVPPCKFRSTAITAIAYEPPDTDLIASTGGLMGSLSFVNVAKGMLASAAPTAIENFWLTGTGAPAPRVVPANSSAMDLTSGKNASIAFAATTFGYVGNAYTRQTEQYTARFSTSLDAVSALLTTSSLYTEYAFSQDQVLNTLVMMTMPTKPYYVLSDPLAPSLGPFSSLWDKTQAQSCDNLGPAAYTREEITPSEPDDFGTRPPRPPSLVCAVANPLISLTNLFYFVYGFPKTDDPTFFASPLALGFWPYKTAVPPCQSPEKRADG